jgi:anti-sigma factor RsiW
VTTDRAWAIDCQDLVELVTDYLEGSLDEELRITFEAHLEKCAACALYVEQMRDVVKHLGRVPLESMRDLPESVVQELLSAFRAEPQ